MYDCNATASFYDMNFPPVDGALPNRRFIAIKEHLFSELNEEAVILSLKNGKYYGLNSVGVTIWKSLQTSVSIDEIETVVMNEYDVGEETCRVEVLRFLEKMLGEELIEAADEESS
ncbi:MAG: lasso peptide biosynthesis PqqD family chaperone [Acidobacteria bacterium]|nr:lasso peptide biosynthesis PqqD family chaperone [Acidobacteriota bacterium]